MTPPPREPRSQRDSRRARGEGSIYYSESQHRWEGSIDIGSGVDGRRTRRKVIGRTQTEVASRLKELRRQIDEGVDLAETMTIKELLDRYLDSRTGSIQASTMAKYQTFADGHLIPALGGRQVAGLRPEHVETLLTHLGKRNYGRATITEVRNLLASALTYAVRRRLVTWNVAQYAEVPHTAPAKGAKQQRRSLSRDETVRFLQAARPERLGSMLAVMAILGLRPGEVTALRWSDVDLHGRELTVSQAMKGGSHTPSRAVGATKTAAGRRTLGMPVALVALLREHKATQARERLALGHGWPSEWRSLVFVTENGTPVDPANLRRLTTRVAKNAGIAGRVLPYELRHTVASLLADTGVTNEKLADHLGHSSTRTLDETYRHVLSASNLAANELGSLLDPSQATPNQGSAGDPVTRSGSIDGR